MENKKYIFTRTFHPVGQGAFYSEIFKLPTNSDKSDEYRVVYDCGSKKDKDWLKNRISESFPTKDVDILFLSHFHDDHYKGIINLQPKIIILPLLDEWDKVIFWIGKQLKKCRIDINYAVKLKNKFPSSRFIYIRPLDEETRRSEESTNLDNRINTSVQNSDGSEADIELNSGSLITNNSIPEWIYIPVNPKLDKSVTDLFRDLLKLNKIDETKLRTLDKDFFLANKEVLGEIYNKIGDPNEFSMAVYSGPNPYLPQNSQRVIGGNILGIGNVYHNCICNYPIHKWQFHHCPSFIYNHREIRRLRIGCLYLGDIKLSDKQNHSLLLQKIYSLFPIDSIYDINTIQVPHHGSIDNYHPSLCSFYDWTSGKWEKFDREILYVISVGESNHYGHPSAWVIKDLLDHGHTIVLVTESPTSTFIERTKWTD